MTIRDLDGLNSSSGLTLSTPSGDFPWTANAMTWVRSSSEATLLIGTNQFYGGVAVATLGKNGALTANGTSEATLYDLLEDLRIASAAGVTYKDGGSAYAYFTGLMVNNGAPIDYHIAVVDVTDPTSFDLLQVIQDDEALGGGSFNTGVEPVIAAAGDKDFLIISSGQNNVMHSYEIGANGILGDVNVTTTSFDFAAGYTTAMVGANSFVIGFKSPTFAPTPTGPLLQVLSLDTTGDLTPVFDLTVDDVPFGGTPLGGAGLTSVKAGGTQYVIMNDALTGGMLSYAMNGAGQLTLVDQIMPDTQDLWASPFEIQSFVHKDQSYVVTGNNGGSLAVFQVSDGGSLFEVDEFALSPNFGRVLDLEVVQFNNKTLFATTMIATDVIASFQFISDFEPITGNKNDNTRKGTQADDQIFGGKGQDTLIGRNGDDLIEGGIGKDRLFGGNGNDDLFGGSANDRIKSAGGNDFVFGGAGGDKLDGNGGADYLVGGGGGDQINGNAEADQLFGGAGSDALFGGSGDDRLTDGAGAMDQMTGGLGADVFILTDDGERDVINDFENGIDLIDLRAEGAMSFLDITLAQSGNKVIARYGDDTLVIKANGPLDVLDLSASDFILIDGP